MTEVDRPSIDAAVPWRDALRLVLHGFPDAAKEAMYVDFIFGSVRHWLLAVGFFVIVINYGVLTFVGKPMVQPIVTAALVCTGASCVGIVVCLVFDRWRDRFPYAAAKWTLEHWFTVLDLCWMSGIIFTGYYRKSSFCVLDDYLTYFPVLDDCLRYTVDGGSWATWAPLFIACPRFKFVLSLELYEMTVRWISSYTFEGKQISESTDYMLQGIWTLSTIVYFAVQDYRNRQRFSTHLQVLQDAEQSARLRDKADQLMQAMMPPVVLAKLVSHADTYHHGPCSMMFCDVVDFTKWSNRRSPSEALKLLNAMYDRFDSHLAEYNVEKVTTIGDAYWASAGIPVPCEDHAVKLSAFALLAVQHELCELRASKTAAYSEIHCRVGVHSGTACCGVVGSRHVAFQVVGGMVDDAECIEQAAPSDAVLLSDAALQELTRQLAVMRAAMSAGGAGALGRSSVEACAGQIYHARANERHVSVTPSGLEWCVMPFSSASTTHPSGNSNAPTPTLAIGGAAGSPLSGYLLLDARWLPAVEIQRAAVTAAAAASDSSSMAAVSTGSMMSDDVHPLLPIGNGPTSSTDVSSPQSGEYRAQLRQMLTRRRQHHSRTPSGSTSTSRSGTPSGSSFAASNAENAPGVAGGSVPSNGGTAGDGWNRGGNIDDSIAVAGMSATAQDLLSIKQQLAQRVPSMWLMTFRHPALELGFRDFDKEASRLPARSSLLIRAAFHLGFIAALVWEQQPQNIILYLGHAHLVVIDLLGCIFGTRLPIQVLWASFFLDYWFTLALSYHPQHYTVLGSDPVFYTIVWVLLFCGCGVLGKPWFLGCVAGIVGITLPLYLVYGARLYLAIVATTLIAPTGLWLIAFRVRENQLRQHYVDYRVALIARQRAQNERDTISKVLERSVPGFAVAEVTAFVARLAESESDTHVTSGDGPSSDTREFQHLGVLFARCVPVAQQIYTEEDPKRAMRLLSDLSHVYDSVLARHSQCVKLKFVGDIVVIVCGEEVEEESALRALVDSAASAPPSPLAGGNLDGFVQDVAKSSRSRRANGDDTASASHQHRHASSLSPSALLLMMQRRASEGPATASTATTSVRRADFSIVAAALPLLLLCRDLEAAVQEKFSCAFSAAVHVGAVVAGIVGHERILYDVFGDTVNTASRIMATCAVEKGGTWLSKDAVAAMDRVSATLAEADGNAKKGKKRSSSTTTSPHHQQTQSAATASAHRRSMKFGGVEVRLGLVVNRLMKGLGDVPVYQVLSTTRDS